MIYLDYWLGNIKKSIQPNYSKDTIDSITINLIIKINLAKKKFILRLYLYSFISNIKTNFLTTYDNHIKIL